VTITSIMEPPTRIKKASLGCSRCGEPLPASLTYLEAVQLKSERVRRIWRYFCEDCLELVGPYQIRSDWERERQ
jgi:hypothetical protein